ncbi:helix-turn-helix domain-containing protein [Enterobacter sp. MGH 24]|nr:helix-turn-helix domain-containing protein [Enterobacter sp. MGH 24]
MRNISAVSRNSGLANALTCRWPKGERLTAEAL